MNLGGPTHFIFLLPLSNSLRELKQQLEQEFKEHLEYFYEIDDAKEASQVMGMNPHALLMVSDPRKMIRFAEHSSALLKQPVYRTLMLTAKNPGAKEVAELAINGVQDFIVEPQSKKFIYSKFNFLREAALKAYELQELKKEQEKLQEMNEQKAVEAARKKKEMNQFLALAQDGPSDGEFKTKKNNTNDQSGQLPADKEKELATNKKKSVFQFNDHLEDNLKSKTSEHGSTDHLASSEGSMTPSKNSSLWQEQDRGHEQGSVKPHSTDLSGGEPAEKKKKNSFNWEESAGVPSKKLDLDKIPTELASGEDLSKKNKKLFSLDADHLQGELSGKITSNLTESLPSAEGEKKNPFHELSLTGPQAAKKSSLLLSALDGDEENSAKKNHLFEEANLGSHEGGSLTGLALAALAEPGRGERGLNLDENLLTEGDGKTKKLDLMGGAEKNQDGGRKKNSLSLLESDEEKKPSRLGMAGIGHEQELKDKKNRGTMLDLAQQSKEQKTTDLFNEQIEKKGPKATLSNHLDGHLAGASGDKVIDLLNQEDEKKNKKGSDLLPESPESKKKHHALLDPELGANKKSSAAALVADDTENNKKSNPVLADQPAAQNRGAQLNDHLGGVEKSGKASTDHLEDGLLRNKKAQEIHAELAKNKSAPVIPNKSAAAKNDQEAPAAEDFTPEKKSVLRLLGQKFFKPLRRQGKKTEQGSAEEAPAPLQESPVPAWLQSIDQLQEMGPIIAPDLRSCDVLYVILRQLEQQGDELRARGEKIPAAAASNLPPADSMIMKLIAHQLYEQCGGILALLQVTTKAVLAFHSGPMYQDHQLMTWFYQRPADRPVAFQSSEKLEAWWELRAQQYLNAVYAQVTTSPTSPFQEYVMPFRSGGKTHTLAMVIGTRPWTDAEQGRMEVLLGTLQGQWSSGIPTAKTKMAAKGKELPTDQSDQSDQADQQKSWWGSILGSIKKTGTKP